MAQSCQILHSGVGHFRIGKVQFLQILEGADRLGAYDRVTLRLSFRTPPFALFMTEKRAVIEPYLPYQDGGDGLVFELARGADRTLGGSSSANVAGSVYDAYFRTYRKLFEQSENVHAVMSTYVETRKEGTTSAYVDFLPMAEKMVQGPVDWSKLE